MATLRELREGAGLTQLEVATRLGVTPGAVYNWERAEREPKARYLAALARIYGVSGDAILAAVQATEERGKVAA